MLKIRPYGKDDSESVWELHNVALHDAGAHPGNGPWDDDLRDIPGVYEQRQGCFWVGTVEGSIVAMGGLKRTDAVRAEIKRVRIHPRFQRRGFGTRILEALEAEAERLGYQVLHLETTTLQTAAQKMYEKYGYERTGGRRIAGFNTIQYEKKLSDSAEDAGTDDRSPR